MAEFLGADTDQLRQHAELMRDRANSLGDLQTRISMLVAYGAEWEGEDAEAFRDRWRSEIAPTFDEQVTLIRTRGTSLDDEAEEQDTTSQEEQAPGLLDNLLGLANIGQDTFKAITDLKKLVDDFPGHVAKWKDAFSKGLGESWKLYKDELAKGLKEGLNFGKEYSSIAKRLLAEAGIPGELGNWNPLEKLDSGKFPKFLGEAAPGLAKLGKFGGKLIPGLDIGLGVHQMMTADNNFDRVSGGLSALSGGLVLAAPLFGPAAPIVAGVGVAAGVVSIGMDLGKLAWDNREAIADFAGDVGEGITNAAGSVADAASNAAESIGDGVENVGNAIKDVGGSIGDALGFG